MKEGTAMDLLLSFDFFPMIGGAHTWMYEVYKRWPNPVTVLANDYGADPDLETEQREFDATDHGGLAIERHPLTVPDISLFNPACVRQFLRINGMIRRLAGDRPCRIHNLRAFPEGIAAAVYKKWLNRSCRLITYVHGEELNVAATSRQLSYYTRRVLRASDLIIVNSRVTRDKTMAFAPGIKEPVVVHPGVEPDVFVAEPEAIERQKKAWGVKENETVLTTIARLEPRKNHRTVLNAMASVHKSGVALRYIIASDGEERQALIDQARDLGISDRVVFSGRISQKEKALTYAASDIHIMPSIEAGPMVEGFGIVFIEAAAAGIPSISGDCGGQAEAVRHGETGLVVDGTDEKMVGDAILKLASDSVLRDRMGQAGRKWADTHDWKQIALQTWEQCVNL